MPRLYKGYLLAVVLIALDLATKKIAVTQLHYATPVMLTSWFDFTLLYNKGAAFSFLSNAGGWQRWFFVSVSALACIALPIWMAKLPEKDNKMLWPLAFVLGGAAGNLYDRASTGEVVDFISLHWQQYYWPAFNIADSVICLGVAWILLIEFTQWLQQKKEV